jgi:hypothetical protein
MNARELGASPIPYGPRAVAEAVGAARRVGGTVARARLAASGHLSGSAQEWIARFEPKEALR